MKQHLYWNAFKAIEKEVLVLSNIVFIDDKQLSVYSMKIADLLIRTAIEIEAIAKELYFQNGGSKANDNNLYFDTDCLDYLNQRWKISDKVVFISSPYFYLSDKYKVLYPLQNAYKRGKGAWKTAYQAIKHNRTENLSKGNIFNLLQALASLFLLNIYLQNQTINLGKDDHGRVIKPNFGSDIFSVKIHKFPGIDASGQYEKSEDYDQCVYLIQATDKPKEKMRQLLEEINQQINKQMLKKLEEMQNLEKIDRQNILKQMGQYRGELMVSTMKANASVYNRAFSELTYEAVLNKQQY